jgi:hypothetical protein
MSNKQNVEIMIFKPLYESPKKEANEEKFGITENSCVCCGKPTTGELYVHMTTSWEVVPNNVSEEELEKAGHESQGCFPIGPSCAKKVGMKFVSK